MTPDRIKTIRKNFGMNITEFSEYSGMCHTMISMWERDRRPIPEYIKRLYYYVSIFPELKHNNRELPGHRLILLRRRLRFNKVEFASIIGASDYSIVDWERGKRPIPKYIVTTLLYIEANDWLIHPFSFDKDRFVFHPKLQTALRELLSQDQLKLYRDSSTSASYEVSKVLTLLGNIIYSDKR